MAQVSHGEDTLVGPFRPRVFRGDALREIAFPLGGIGTGTIALGGRGELRDWEVFNRPAKGASLPLTLFALWVQRGDGSSVARVLEREFLPPFVGPRGFPRQNLSGLGRFREATFQGEYPFAWLDLEDPRVPVHPRLEAWNPLIPLNVDDSSLPLAAFEWTLTNPTNEQLRVSLLACMTNPIGWQNIGVSSEIDRTLNQWREGDGLRGIYFSAPEVAESDPNSGTACLVTPWQQVDVQTRLYRGVRWDAAQRLWDEFTADGRLEELIEARFETGVDPEAPPFKQETGALCLRADIPAGGAVKLPVVIAWHVPHMKAWTDDIIVRTHVDSQFSDAWHAAGYFHAERHRLKEQTQRWRDALFGSSLPDYVLDAVSSQISTLRTNTCVRLADGTFFGWEGCTETEGCCYGTCTHVWNYEQTLAFLFPQLERSMRRVDFLQDTLPDGRMDFRSAMPLATRQERFKPCADGQMGTVMRAYREWQLSGDDGFLRELWPSIVRALEFAWTYPNGWDPNRDGVMEGVQHNTYDLDFYGPNSLCGSLYLGALRAAAAMARHLGEDKRAALYEDIYESGRQRTEAELWNDEYYIQKVEVPAGHGVPERLRSPEGGPSPKFQYGEGCLSDQLLGQWLAHVVGLGYLLDSQRVKSAMDAVFRHNFRRAMREHHNVQRVYALQDEAGLLVCTWPRGGRPALPFFYCDQVWTGIEYQVASHLIYEGLLREGLTIVKAVRDRHDGARRNPWDEFECGHHYARAMSSWSVLLALSGFHYSAVEGRLSFKPALPADGFRCVFCAGTAWGTLTIANGEAQLRVEYGELTLRQFAVGGSEEKYDEARTLCAGDVLTLGL